MPKFQARISIAMQNYLIQNRFPQFRCNGMKGTGIWRGTLQPTIVSPNYHILLKYNLHQSPRVWIEKPEIKDNAPHRYKDRSLCLYWGKEWLWYPDQDISLTILPWTALWLYYYEIWLDTGDWMAESAPHGPII